MAWRGCAGLAIPGLLHDNVQNFSENDIKELLSGEAAIACLEAAFLRDWRSTAKMPARPHLPLAGGGSFLVMPCADDGVQSLGMKVVTVRPQAAAGEPRVQAVFFLFNHASGQLEAIMQANHLTAMRTAALSAVATKVLSRPESRVLGIFGTGVQAWSHWALLPLVRRFAKVLVCGSSPERSREFAQRAAGSHDLEVLPADAAACAQQSDVLCTCTTSAAPLFDGALVRAGSHLNLVGAFQPETREVDEAVIGRAHIVVDTYEGALAEAGDLVIPLQMGMIENDAIADLHDVMTSKMPGRRNEQEITVFKSVGCAYEDLVIARLLYDAAAARGPTAK